MEDLKELREKKIAELEYSTVKKFRTLEEMHERGIGKSSSSYEEVFDDYNDSLNELSFVKSLSDDEFIIYLKFPFNKVSQILPFNFYFTQKKFDEYKKVFKIIVSIIKKEGEIFEETESFLSISEPLKKNHFLVKIPDYFNISVKDVVSFEYDREGKRILLKVREACGKKQIKRIINFLNDESNNPVPYENIVVQHLTPSYEVDYTHIFKGVVLTGFYEEPLTYDVEYDDDKLRYFQMQFEYIRDIIEDETTSQENDKS